MDNKMKKRLTRIIIAFLFVIISFFIEFNNNLYNNILFFMAYVIIGYDIVLKAIRNISRGHVFDENFLMTIATIGAILIGELPEGVAVMLFYQVGELFQSYAVDRSRKSVASLMDIRPDYANVYRNKEISKVDPDDVSVGEIILVKPGEKIPLDGTVIEGEAMLNTLALTGESIPRHVTSGEKVFSGCINNDGTLKIRVDKEFGESTVSKILDLVENASSRKSKSENFISKFAKYYTPIVVIIAVALAIVPPLIIDGALFKDWVYRALSFLVVSCPCALVISIPLSFFGGIGAASRIGVLVKGSNYLESLANTEIIVCDKTGTLTEGVFKVQKVDAIDYQDDELLKYAAYCECFSNHPIAISLREAYNKEIDESLVTKTKEISGKGVFSIVDKREVLVGNNKLMDKYKIDFKESSEVGTVIYVAIDKKFVGSIVIADKIKEDSYKAIELFKKNNVERIIMLTGDLENISRDVADKLNLDEYYAELLPHDKVSLVENFIEQKSFNGKLVFIGDGINDAPVLALADIGIAMGGLGSDAAIEASDVVIMTDEVSKLASCIEISKKTMRIVKENIIFAIFVKILVLILSALGIVSMWAAVFADVGVSVIAIINALRILRVKK